MRSLRRTKTKETSIKVKLGRAKAWGGSQTWLPPHNLSTLHTTRSENTDPLAFLRSPALQARFIIKRRDAPREVSLRAESGTGVVLCVGGVGCVRGGRGCVVSVA